MLVENHAELAHFLQLTTFCRVECEAVAPHVEVAFGEAHDVTWLQQDARFIPDAGVDAGALVGDFECAHLTVFLRQRRMAHFQHDEERVHVLQPWPHVFDLHVVVHLLRGRLAGEARCVT